MKKILNILLFCFCFYLKLFAQIEYSKDSIFSQMRKYSFYPYYVLNGDTILKYTVSDTEINTVYNFNVCIYIPINKIDSIFKIPNKINDLNFNSNTLNFDIRFDKLDSLKILMYCANKVTFSDSIKDLKSLIFIGGTNSGYANVFPNFLYNSVNLFEIYINVKKFDNFSDSIIKLDKLEKLDLMYKKNKTDTLNEKIFELPNLKSLALNSFHDIKKIEITPNISQAKNLQELFLPIVLDLRNIEILSQIPKLQRLAILKIELEDYSEIQKLSNLSELYISKTNKKELEILKQYLPNTKINNK